MNRFALFLDRLLTRGLRAKVLALQNELSEAKHIVFRLQDSQVEHLSYSALRSSYKELSEANVKLQLEKKLLEDELAMAQKRIGQLRGAIIAKMQEEEKELINLLAETLNVSLKADEQ